MRDDRIAVIGPLEVEDLLVPEYTDTSSGEVVLAHPLRMDHMRRFRLECQVCPCERVHVVSFDVQLHLMLGYPQVLEYALDEAFYRMREGLDQCAKDWAI